jgi:hypothetical protein
MPLSLAERSIYGVSQYTNSNPAWVQFIRDHRAFLWARAVTIPIDPEQMNAYKYRPRAFLVSQGIPGDQVWITLWLNGIDPLKFDNLETLKAPPQSTITALYQAFVANTEKTTAEIVASTVRTTVGI